MAIRGEPKLLDQVRSALRVHRYSRRTQEAYVSWIRRFVIFHGKHHPRQLGEGRWRSFSRTWRKTVG